MKVGIIGGGVVGKATARTYLEYAEVRLFDLQEKLRTHSYEETLASDLVFVCLPTPRQEDSLEADLSILNTFFQDLITSQTCFVLKSTVPVGTTRYLRDEYGLDNLVHSPEFLTARCSYTDALLPTRNIIGGQTCEAMIRLGRLYHERFPGVPLLLTSSEESELIKLTVNGFFATKVAYFNEVRSLAEKIGANWDTVIEGVLGDGRITHSHTKVPGPDGHYGFGGSCLPKDLASLVTCLTTHKLRNDVTKGAYSRNLYDRRKPK